MDSKKIPSERTTPIESLQKFYEIWQKTTDLKMLAYLLGLLEILPDLISKAWETPPKDKNEIIDFIIFLTARVNGNIIIDEDPKTENNKLARKAYQVLLELVAQRSLILELSENKNTKPRLYTCLVSILSTISECHDFLVGECEYSQILAQKILDDISFHFLSSDANIFNILSEDKDIAEIKTTFSQFFYQAAIGVENYNAILDHPDQIALGLLKKAAIKAMEESSNNDILKLVEQIKKNYPDQHQQNKLILDLANQESHPAAICYFAVISALRLERYKLKVS